MHQAPPVTWMVSRTRFHASLLVLLAASVVGVHAAWWLHAQDGPYHPMWTVGGLLMAGLLAWRNWADVVPGSLCWDGQQWSWAGHAGPAVAGVPVVAMDLQVAMLIDFRAPGASRRWFWVVPGGQSAAWRALRRALFSGSARPGAAVPVAAPRP